MINTSFCERLEITTPLSTIFLLQFFDFVTKYILQEKGKMHEERYMGNF